MVVTKCPPGTRGVWAPLVSVGTACGAVSPRKGWHYRHGRDPGGEVEVMTDWGSHRWLVVGTQVSERESKVRGAVGRAWNPEPTATLKTGGSPRRSS